MSVELEKAYFINFQRSTAPLIFQKCAAIAKRREIALCKEMATKRFEQVISKRISICQKGENK